MPGRMAVKVLQILLPGLGQNAYRKVWVSAKGYATFEIMERGIHRLRRMAPGAAALAMALLYLVISTQFAFPLRERVEASVKTESVVQASSILEKEAFACVLHKCGCKNAEQCRTSCCCFPKAPGTHSLDGSHDHGESRGERHMAHYRTCNGPDGHDHGLPPLLSAHLLPRPAPLPDPLLSRSLLPAVRDGLQEPFSEPPLKV